MFHSSKENIFCYLFHSSFFHTIFGKLIFWRNIDRRAPYKNGKICIILTCVKKIFLGKIIYSTHQRKCFSTMLGNFRKIEFLKEYRQARTLKKWWKFVLSQFVLRKYSLAKLFVPLIIRKCFSTILGIFLKIEFLKEYRQAHTLKKWWKFVLSQFVLRKYFLAKLFVPLIKESVSPQFQAIFGKLNFWRNIDRREPYKNGEYLYYLKLCKEIIFWQNYLFHSSKEEFLHNFRQFLENWIFEGISTGADLTKMVKICIISNCAKKIFFCKIFCSTHQKKCFSTILGNFWKIEFLKEYRQARALTKTVKICIILICAKKIFFGKIIFPPIKRSVCPQF